MSKVFFLTTALFFIALVNSQIYNPNAFAGCDCGAPTSTCICYCDAATSYTNATMFNGTVGSNPSVFGGWMELIPVGFIGYYNFFFVGNANANGGTSGLTAWGVSSSDGQTRSEFARYMPDVLRGSLSYYIDFPPTTDGQIMAIGTSACTLSSSGTGNLLVNGQDVVGIKASANGMNVVQTWPNDRSQFDFSLNVVGGSTVSLNNVAAPPGGLNNYFYLRSINNGVPAYMTNLKLCTIACDSVQSFNISNGISGGSIFAFSSMNSFIYATGSFTTVNGQSANFAMYTGSSWTALAAFNTAPLTLAYARNRIFIGGSFSSYTKPGGSATACERFASIDSNGNIFCYTNGYNANGFVRTLKAVGDVIYIGGKLLPSNSAVWSYNAATLDFIDMGTNQPYSDGNGYVSAIESHNGEIHVALVCDTIYPAFRVPESEEI